MLKRIVLIVAMLMLSAALVGCSCSATATTPSPAPTSTISANVGASPSAEGNQGGPMSQSPDSSIGPDLGTSPNVSTSPDAGTGSGTGTGSGAGGTGTGTTIPNFKEGTEVKESEVPEVKKAIEAQYAGAQIQSIKHATVDGAQVYAVEIKTGGTTQTVHVKPDGSFAQKAS